MMKLDLKDAYYTLPIHHSHRKYLRFVFQDRTYEFQCLPFGLSSAPRAFTKTLKPVLAVLRSMGIRVVIYIDNMLLLNQQSKVLQKIFAEVVDLLEKLGFLVKKEKCSLHSLPTSNLPRSCPRLHQDDPVPPPTKPYLHCGYLPSPHCSREWLSEDSVHVNWTNEPCITNRDLGCTTSLQRPSTPIPASSVTTWAGKESDCPLNLPDTQRPRVVGATLALKALLQSQEVQHPPLKHIHLRIDNTTAVGYINKRGGMRSPALTAQALELWAVALTAGVSLTAQHIPGIQNVVADSVSRQIETRTKWTSDRKIFQSICQRFYTPEVDLFASRLNHQLPIIY